MAVLLEGINIPEGNPITINIYRNGTWVNAYTAEDGNAIEVPEPHGDLIDREYAIKRAFDYLNPEHMLEDMPTVIPASEEG